MENTVNISATIVLYKEDVKRLQKTIDSFLQTPLSKKLFLIDNSPTDFLKNLANHPNITYVFNNKNIGFGKAHNLVIDSIKNKSKYHLILNPDVFFTPNVIPNLIKELERKEELAMIAPKVLFPNGKHQYSCRRYPKPFELFFRRFNFIKPISSKIIDNGIYKDKDISKPFEAEYITGCFQLYKTKDFIALNGFDKRYFLYMEDVDICKKIDLLGKKKMYYPYEKIYHYLKKESSKNIILFFRHFSSAIKYFIKW